MARRAPDTESHQDNSYGRERVGEPRAVTRESAHQRDRRCWSAGRSDGRYRLGQGFHWRENCVTQTVVARIGNCGEGLRHVERSILNVYWGGIVQHRSQPRRNLNRIEEAVYDFATFFARFVSLLERAEKNISMKLDQALLRSLPKVLLHEHLD